MSDRIFGVNGKFYTSQKSIGLYPTSGTASDWYVTLLNEIFLSYDSLKGSTQIMPMRIMVNIELLVLLLSFVILVCMAFCYLLIR